MLEMSRRPLVLAVVAALAGLPAAAHADLSGKCQKIDFTPASATFQPQIVAWLEDGSGNFIATAFMTQQTGRFGLGNRPGRYDFNSGPQWPYGRRINVFPVWAHRQPFTFPTVRFQLPDGNHDCCDTEEDLSHSRDISSQETHFCPPELPSTPMVDAITCASLAFTDKGVFDDVTTCSTPGAACGSEGGTCGSNGLCQSLYPPRADQGTGSDDADSLSVAMYAALNPFDAITGATPPGNTPYEITWGIPSTLPNGNYVLWMEVSEEFDSNSTYNAMTYPAPQVPYSDYGAPYRGQPSMVWSVPFALSDGNTIAESASYVGYGDITGMTGNLNAPDSTITTTVPGSGPLRLEMVSDGSGGQYQIKVTTFPNIDKFPPGAPTAMAASAATPQTATVTFTEPGDGTGGVVGSYQIRELAGGGVITDANFDTAIPVSASVLPTGPGTVQTVTLTGLVPQTNYSVGIRAVDQCGNVGSVAVVSFSTPERTSGEVDACFIATAAYGSLMANDVELLRRFRDVALRHSVLGELFVEGYYTFGPPLAGVVGESELLRSTARDALAPVVDRVRTAEQRGALP
jgi:hypothetical protein